MADPDAVLRVPKPSSAAGSRPITKPLPHLLVGFWKKGSGRAVDRTGLRRATRRCASGGSTGVRKSLGDDAYTIRFTPRRVGSIWSKVNVERYDALTAAGLMSRRGELAYERDKHQQRASIPTRSRLAKLAPEDGDGFVSQ